MRKATSKPTKRSSRKSSKGLTAVSPGLSRADLYAANREHVHITRITCDYTRTGEYTTVEPGAYLY